MAGKTDVNVAGKTDVNVAGKTDVNVAQPAPPPQPSHEYGLHTREQTRNFHYQ